MTADFKFGILLWIATALLLLTAGAVLVRACGVTFLRLDYCGGEALSSDRQGLGEQRQLVAERDDLLAAINRNPQCDLSEEQADATCQMPPSDDVLVLVDASLSMGSDFDADPQLEEQLNELYIRLGSAWILEQVWLRGQIADLEQQIDRPDLPDRIDIAKGALSEFAGLLPDGGSLRLMSFATCEAGVLAEGSYSAADDEAYRRAVAGIGLRENTHWPRRSSTLPGRQKRGVRLTVR